MRCVACNIELNDYEATRKDSNNQYLDLCNTCFKASEYEFDTSDRLDLIEEADYDLKDDLEYLHTPENMLEY